MAARVERFRCQHCGFDDDVVLFGDWCGTRSPTAMLHYQRDTAPCFSCGKRPAGAATKAILSGLLRFGLALAIGFGLLVIIANQGIRIGKWALPLMVAPFVVLWYELQAWTTPGRKRHWPGDTGR